jgi:hypothetical protein
MDTPLQTLRARVAPLERLIHAFANSLGEPQLRSTDPDMGFRFLTPDVRHFCLLKGIRVVSALNASLELARYPRDCCLDEDRVGVHVSY